MDPRLDCLADVYRCFLADSSPSQSSAVVASVIFSGVCGLEPNEDRSHVPAENTADLTCSCLTLVEKMTSNLACPQVALYCTETLSTLFRDMDVMSQLVLHFRNEERIIAHLAAKCASATVVYGIHTSGTVAPVWLQKCVRAFHGSAPGCELDSCLWSVTDVLKQLLKGARAEIFGEIVASLDSSLCALCSRFFSERTMTTQGLVDLTRDQHWKATLCLLLDLLEVLTASSLTTAACVKSQRLTLLLSPALLTTISCTSSYFVKKRVVLLLKRAVLQKPGEDWALGEGPSIGPRNEQLGSDWSILAETVLSAVAANWLQTVQVESASSFGGTRHVGYNKGLKADFVIVRGVSLLLLKSMELHMQTAEVDSEHYGHLQKLWEFLRRCSVGLSETSHICCLVGTVFGEQDDDMMEAAKALLSIFLHHRRCSRLDEADVLEAACASGCNPHCHFLFLLQSVSFDHSILLDFLISTETCFLEYFVRYLKYLTVHWQGFTAACRRIGVSDALTSSTCSGRSDVSALTCNDRSQMESIRLLTGSRLVEYESSESDREDEPETSQCEDGRFNGSRLKWETVTPQMKPPQGLSLHSVSSQQTSSNIAACDTLARALLCLSELRQVVMRLHAKKLFPYNPSSLVKLLVKVQTCSSDLSFHK